MQARITMAAFAIAALAALGPVPHATAATGAVSCVFQGGGTTTGVVMNATPQDYQFTGTLTCDPTSEVSSGTVTATGHGVFGCASVGDTSHADLLVTWNDGSQSGLHIDFTHVAVELAGTGSVDGRFAGRSLVGDMLFYVAPTVDNPAAPVLEGGKCGSSPGLTAASLAGVYTILP